MKSFVAISALLLFVGIGCEAPDPQPENSDELITTLTVRLVPDSSGQEVMLSFFDPDGDGGIPATITGGTLTRNTDYTAVLALFNESVSPAQDVGDEILEEALDHQFFFIPMQVDLTVSYADEDANGYPVGLLNTFRTGSSGAGSLTVILRHEPDKMAPGVRAGAIENAGGDTDLEVFFDVSIE